MPVGPVPNPLCNMGADGAPRRKAKGRVRVSRTKGRRDAASHRRAAQLVLARLIVDVAEPTRSTSRPVWAARELTVKDETTNHNNSPSVIAAIDGLGASRSFSLIGSRSCLCVGWTQGCI